MMNTSADQKRLIHPSNCNDSYPTYDLERMVQKECLLQFPANI